MCLEEKEAYLLSCPPDAEEREAFDDDEQTLFIVNLRRSKRNLLVPMTPDEIDACSFADDLLVQFVVDKSNDKIAFMDALMDLRNSWIDSLIEARLSRQ